MSRLAALPLTRATLVMAVLAASGCGDISAGKPATPSTDVLRLFINNALETEHVNGVLPITVHALGGAPEAVELFLDGVPLATLLPPFQHTWDTAGVEEGLHHLQARTLWKGRSIMSARHAVSVDRTGPTVVEVAPHSTHGGARHASTLQVRFSEPVRFASAEGVRARVWVNGRELTPRMSLSYDGMRMFAPIGAPASLSAVGSASLPLAGITDRAGNPAQYAPEQGPRYSWTWSAPLFPPEPSFISSWGPDWERVGFGWPPCCCVPAPRLRFARTDEKSSFGRPAADVC